MLLNVISAIMHLRKSEDQGFHKFIYALVFFGFMWLSFAAYYYFMDNVFNAYAASFAGALLLVLALISRAYHNYKANNIKVKAENMYSNQLMPMVDTILKTVPKRKMLTILPIAAFLAAFAISHKVK